MTRPLAGWETHGDYTTHLEEQAFLEAIASDTAATLAAIGATRLGTPIWALTLGTPGKPVWLINGAVHGTELSGREAALMWIRDLAYSADPDDLSYLQNHQVVFVPTMNADGAQPPRTRTNSADKDLNRDWFQLTQPETRAVKQLMTSTGAALILDLHEWGTATCTQNWGYSWTGGGTLSPTTALGTLGADLKNTLVAALTDNGFTSVQYPSSNAASGAGTLLQAAVPAHQTAILSEVLQRVVAKPERIILKTVLLNAFCAWHATNSAALESAKSASINAAIAGSSPLMVPMEGASWEVKPDPGFYEVPEWWDVPQELLDLHGIEMVGRTISTAQAARGVIPVLFDPESTQYVVGMDWEGNGPNAASERHTLGPIVKHEGVRRRAKSIVVKQDGVRRRVKSVTVNQDGYRRRVA